MKKFDIYKLLFWLIVAIFVMSVLLMCSSDGIDVFFNHRYQLTPVK